MWHNCILLGTEKFCTTAKRQLKLLKKDDHEPFLEWLFISQPKSIFIRKGTDCGSLYLGGWIDRGVDVWRVKAFFSHFDSQTGQWMEA
jgi:hypothetical protein